MWEYKIEESCAPFLNEEESLQRFNREIINKGMVKICKLIKERKKWMQKVDKKDIKVVDILWNCKGYLIKRQLNFVQEESEYHVMIASLDTQGESSNKWYVDSKYDLQQNKTCITVF